MVYGLTLKEPLNFCNKQHFYFNAVLRSQKKAWNIMNPQCNVKSFSPLKLRKNKFAVRPCLLFSGGVGGRGGGGGGGVL